AGAAPVGEATPPRAAPPGPAPHAPATHVPGEQSVAAGATHAPVPSHAPTPTACVGSEHVALPHGVVPPGKLHTAADKPSHDPAHAPLPAHARRDPPRAPLTT